MDIIQNYNQCNLVYLAKPTYGGWVTFTAHLSHKYKYPLFKVAKRNEQRKRPFGYDVFYQNVSIDEVVKLPNIMITAVDKHYWEYLHLFPKGTKLVIHDPTELKTSSKNPNPLIPLLSHFHIITIRETVQKYLQDTFQIQSEYKIHPFYEYPLQNNLPSMGHHSVSISRIDFDKHTDIILKANQLITKEEDKIRIYGAENRLYVHHKLRELDFSKWWLGKFPKTLPLTYNESSILNDCTYVVDMSLIKNDGGGTQYTFLESIYEDCILILQNDWIKQGSTFISGVNCIGVSTPQELADIINGSITYDLTSIRKNSTKLLRNHCLVQW